MTKIAELFNGSDFFNRSLQVYQICSFGLVQQWRKEAGMGFWHPVVTGLLQYIESNQAQEI